MGHAGRCVVREEYEWSDEMCVPGCRLPLKAYSRQATPLEVPRPELPTFFPPGNQ